MSDYIPSVVQVIPYEDYTVDVMKVPVLTSIHLFFMN